LNSRHSNQIGKAKGKQKKEAKGEEGEKRKPKKVLIPAHMPDATLIQKYKLVQAE